MADEFTVPPKTTAHLKKLNDLFRLINPKWDKPRVEFVSLTPNPWALEDLVW